MAAPPPNLAFELPGAARGSAAGWVLSSGSSTLAGGPSRLAAGFSAVDPVGGPAADPAAPFASPNDFTTGWTVHGATVTANVTTAPDGTLTADRLVDGFAPQVHYIDETAGPRVFKAGVTYTVGCYFKDAASGAPYFGPQVDIGGQVIGATPIGAGLPTVASVSTASGPYAFVSAEVLDGGNGWVCIALSFRLSSQQTGRPGFAFSAGSSYAGTGAGHYIWGAFLYADELAAAESWENGGQPGTYITGLTLGVTSLGAIFGNGTVPGSATEGFEGGWGAYLLTIAGTSDGAVFDAGVSDVSFEDFEADTWDATYFGAPFPNPPTTVCVFDAANTASNVEDFESVSWDVDYALVLAFPPVATFDGTNAENYEDFEEVLADALYVANAAANTFTIDASRSLPNGTRVRPINVGGAFPSGLLRTLDYYVVNTAANVFQLSLSPGGAVVDITDAGTGDNYVRGSAALYWNSPDILV